MKKAEVYRTLIDIHKKMGQGLSGIVKLGNDPTIAGHLDDLIAEGLVKANSIGDCSLGHPESNIFYMPTKGYNVWEDNPSGGRFTGEFLSYVRLYVGCLKLEAGKEFEPSITYFLRSPEHMTKYAAWLTKNEKELKIMTELDETYYGEELCLLDEEKEHIKSFKWFKPNLTVKTLLNKLMESNDLTKEALGLRKKLIELYDPNTESDKIEELKKDIDETKRDLSMNKRIIKYLHTQELDEVIAI